MHAPCEETLFAYSSQSAVDVNLAHSNKTAVENLSSIMPELKGRALLLTVNLLTSLGFMLIGYDNGLMGGLVGAPAFRKTFDNPSSDMIGTIVAIFESK